MSELVIGVLTFWIFIIVIGLLGAWLRQLLDKEGG